MSTVLVPELELPTSIKDTLAAYRVVESDRAKSIQAAREAEAALNEAAALDRRTLADQRSLGQHGPPPRQHRDAAERELRDAAEVLAADDLRVADARTALIGVMLNDAHRWEARISKARQKTEGDLASTLRSVRDLVDDLAELVAVGEFITSIAAARSDRDFERLLRRGLRRTQPTSDLTASNREPMPISTLLDALARWASSAGVVDAEAEVEHAAAR